MIWIGLCVVVDGKSVVRLIQTYVAASELDYWTFAVVLICWEGVLELGMADGYLPEIGPINLVSSLASTVAIIFAVLAVWKDKVLWTPFAGAANPRTFRVTDVGLVVERPLQQRLRPWSAVASYTLTDNALIIHPSAWWRPAYQSDRADIEDLDAAVAALNEIRGDDK